MYSIAEMNFEITGLVNDASVFTGRSFHPTLNPGNLEQFLELPDVVLKRIFSKVSPGVLVDLGKTCRRFRSIISTDYNAFEKVSNELVRIWEECHEGKASLNVYVGDDAFGGIGKTYYEVTPAEFLL